MPKSSAAPRVGDAIEVNYPKKGYCTAIVRKIDGTTAFCLFKDGMFAINLRTHSWRPADDKIDEATLQAIERVLTPGAYVKVSFKAKPREPVVCRIVAVHGDGVVTVRRPDNTMNTFNTVDDHLGWEPATRAEEASFYASRGKVLAKQAKHASGGGGGGSGGPAENDRDLWLKAYCAFVKALELLEGDGSSESMLFWFHQAAGCAAMYGNIIAAERHFLAAIEASTTLSMEAATATLMIQLGSVLLNSSKPKEGMKHLMNGTDMLERLVGENKVRDYLGRSDVGPHGAALHLNTLLADFGKKLTGTARAQPTRILTLRLALLKMVGNCGDDDGGVNLAIADVSDALTKAKATQPASRANAKRKAICNTGGDAAGGETGGDAARGKAK